MSCLFYILWILYGTVFFVRYSAAQTGNSSFPRTSYTYHLDSGLPSTWYNNNSVIMDGGKKMRVILVIQGYNRKIGFYCGFYSDGSSNFYSLSVVAVAVAVADGVGDHNVVWSTDRNSFVKENASLQLTRDEGLVLRDSNGDVVWSANKSGKPVVGMNLTEAGNLVLFGNEGTVLWQSFDHPRDTLLIGQKLYKDQKLVPSFFSTKGSNSPFFAALTTAPYFSAFFNTSDGQFLMYYQLALNNNSRNHSVLQYGKAEQKEFVANMGTYSKSSNLLESIVFVKLDQGGRLKTYTYNPMSSSTHIVDMVSQECQNSSAPHLLKEVRDITYPDISNADIEVVPTRTIDDCRKACLQNCSCIAFVFRNGKDISEGSCYMPSEIYSTEHNSTGQSNSLAFIKVLNTNGEPVAPSSSWTARHRKELIIIITASTSGGVAMIVVVFLVMSPKNQKEDDGEENLKQALGMPSRFSLEELLIATENFKETLGVGGFGSVFKGILAENGTRIAVKHLDKMSQGMREFLAEVETIGNLHHFNLVRLVGFCAEKSCRLLVYEYMSNGSLNNWIFNPNQSQYLDWQTRMNIILDIAKGLAYLHEECRQKIIHLDIKPHNILLDEEFHAKVSDFGLSKLIERDESQVLIPMRGTPGYLAPELQKSIVTVKADVYSFGIVVLEIVSRRRNVDSSRSESSFHLLEMLQKKAEEDNLIEVVEDLDEDMLNNREDVIKMIRIGAWCLQNDHTKRPSMSTVVKVLEGLLEVDPGISYKFSHAMAFASDANDHNTVAPQASFLSAPR
ncbi:G-type lectin S-receptor-like serine/threonine-protein kinase SD2-5 [Humulus lupulus]|uniref:G-type lectin S-receptor-like serine/threonine-protein kinase SD2-5 n=1 Tax=Humulus lupulus TaxID=3486 RepID=UPI002B412F87|nr:G-type lectin S-receptor-like serine/threonine-protein kinase SD2-5 [Humulus lupulus]